MHSHIDTHILTHTYTTCKHAHTRVCSLILNGHCSHTQNTHTCMSLTHAFTHRHTHTHTYIHHMQACTYTCMLFNSQWTLFTHSKHTHMHVIDTCIHT